MTELMRQEINLQNCRGEMDVNIHLKLDTINTIYNCKVDV